MSAPKRTPTQHRTPSAETGPSATASRSIPVEDARQIESRTKWLAQLRKNISENRTAGRAWAMLVRAELETATLRTLWTYAHPPAAHLEKAQRKVQGVTREINALFRAGKVEKQRRATRDPRADLFFDHYWRKHLAVVRAGMPFADDGITVGGWVLSRKAAGKGMPDLPDLRKAFVSLGPRGPVPDRKFWLFVLHCHAANAGIRLGAERLAALACCSDPDANLDARTLARFLASMPPSFKAKCRRDFRNLPAPPLFPPHDS